MAPRAIEHQDDLMSVGDLLEILHQLTHGLPHERSIVPGGLFAPNEKVVGFVWSYFLQQTHEELVLVADEDLCKFWLDCRVMCYESKKGNESLCVFSLDSFLLVLLVWW